MNKQALGNTPDNAVAGRAAWASRVTRASRMAPRAAQGPEAAGAPRAATVPAANETVGLAPAFAASLDAPVLQAPKAHAWGNRRTLLAACLGAAALLVVVVIAGICLQDTATATNFAAKNLAPELQHPFGTDWMGRDMFARTTAGLSTSILVGLLAAGASSIIALVLGTAAALGGRRVDAVLSWCIDLMMGIPHLVLLVLISYALGKGFWGVAIGVALTHWASLARVVRAEVLQCRDSGFVQAARHLGQTPLQIARKHMLPAVLPQYLVGLILLFPHAILHEAAITFLGFGLPPEMPAIGVILSESMSYLSTGAWWLAVFPGLALIAVVLLFDATGSTLRRLLDPRTNQE